ncbi:MAG: SlyX family protein [Pseudomonadales bacterium]|nr:SlyX family protein [Pseudomonadales bacterium]
MNDKRFEEIETKLAYQEHTIQELNDVIYQQQQQIDKLELICRRHSDTLKEFSVPMDQGKPQDEKPPHY